MKRSVVVVLLSVFWCTVKPAASQEPVVIEVGGSVALANDYRFRGISQTQREMAVQAGIDVSGPVGLYGGVWGSNLNFGETSPDGRAQAEIDVFGGIQRNPGGVVDLDLGVTYYGYPGTSRDYNYSFVEVGFGAGRDFSVVSTGVSAAYSPDYFGGSGSALYVRGELGVPVPSTPLSLDVAVGRQAIEDNAVFGTPDYTDWSIGLKAGVAGFEAGVSYVGTDIDDADCVGGLDICEPSLLVNVSLSLSGGT